ncbi:phage scaffolding protein [Enterococcus cecorum]|uniref:phage scaffolding protein n=1 Tax=Enterococcus cecorum TaxID=44008 RepID=UPI000699E099|nr:phage scaffolding protein [Enterococcus cecorum]CAI3370667.1 phage scaffolding protein [Enterococcus cecorum]
MKREDLEALGLEKEVVDKVMGLYGQSVNQLKTDLETEKAKNAGLEKDIKERDKALNELQSKNKDNADLSEKLADLQATYADLKKQSMQEIENLKRDNAIAAALAEAKAKDPALVAKSLDLELIKLNTDGTVAGLKEQVEQLKTTHAYLFDMGTGAAADNSRERKTPQFSSDLATAMASKDFNLTEYVQHLQQQ